MQSAQYDQTNVKMIQMYFEALSYLSQAEAMLIQLADEAFADPKLVRDFIDILQKITNDYTSSHDVFVRREVQVFLEERIKAQ